jgi:triosephosphate isomerase
MSEKKLSEKKILAANWKLNKNPKQTAEFFSSFLPVQVSLAPNALDHFEFVFFPPAFCLQQTQMSLQQTAIGYGPQNIYTQFSGAFTGENSVSVAKDMGAKYALIGHSERRQYFHEAHDLLSEKLKAVLSQDLIPVFCIGETLEERKSNKTKDVLKLQITTAFESVAKDQNLMNSLKNTSGEKLIIAYEPVWAIGTGLVASLEQVAEAHSFIYEQLQTLGLTKTAILYGGSVKAENARELSQVPYVNGFLVGGASLEVKSFLSIAQAMM